MDRLSILLTLMTGSVLVGTMIVVFFTLGLYSWPYIITAAVLGNLLAWPAAYYISRRIKQNDPDWNHRRAQNVDGLIPEANAREV